MTVKPPNRTDINLADTITSAVEPPACSTSQPTPYITYLGKEG